ncbi:hypothetical protein GGD46_004184 [Rhizobium lusitanum]|uniref:Uncharacterized protein n=1 Tax=Rhizobium lusitanum TaxID=293958 RepID=A0A7X0ITI2_9HYPH|nr:hypothetical protein [Rhizobium lusitanum]
MSGAIATKLPSDDRCKQGCEPFAAVGGLSAQSVLRRHLKNGLIAIPKSADLGPLTQNLGLFDFSLDAGHNALPTSPTSFAGRKKRR